MPVILNLALKRLKLVVRSSLMKATYSPERENPLEKTQQAWAEVVEKHQLKCIKKNYLHNKFSTHACYLSKGDLTVKGSGKGKSSAELDISASFEALEYYLAGYFLHPYPMLSGTLAELEKHHTPVAYRCNADIFIENAMNATIPWVVYKDIRTEKSYAVPMASVDLTYRASPLRNHDDFNYDQCALYAASNGLASGTSYEEAVIHAALEVLERDAYSYLLIDTFILKKPINIINNQSLPPDILNLLNEIENDYLSQVFIIQMPSRYGVHAYIATFSAEEFEIQPHGSGASLNAKYAIERAVFELVQSYNLMKAGIFPVNIDLSKAKGRQLIHASLKFDLKEMIANQYSMIEFQDNSSEFCKLDLTAYLDKIIELIYDQSSSLLINHLYQDPNGVACVRVIVPEAEEFFLLTHYMELKPKKLTESYIVQHLGKKFDWNDLNLS